jgi:hypothetical protein
MAEATCGWTVVASQVEPSPAGWNDGITEDRPAATYFDTGFTLSSAQIPNHSSFAVGRRISGSMEILDGVNANYATGDMFLLGVTGIGSAGATYDIHRNASSFFNWHDPELASGFDPGWNNTLTFDANTPGGSELTWAFSPQAGPNQRGYSYNGADRQTQPDSHAWLVYVR